MYSDLWQPRRFSSTDLFTTRYKCVFNFKISTNPSLFSDKAGLADLRFLPPFISEDNLWDNWHRLFISQMPCLSPTKQMIKEFWGKRPHHSGRIFHNGEIMWHRPDGSVAAGSCHPAFAVTDFSCSLNHCSSDHLAFQTTSIKLPI